MSMKTNKIIVNKVGYLTSAGFPIKMSAPAKRALANAGYTHLEQLALVSEDEVKKLHGVGPHALKLLEQALQDKGLDFKNDR
jgi:DNA-directed RNA polymerase alpha subunit